MFRVRHIALFVLLVCWLSVPLAVDAAETVRIGVLAKRGEEQTLNRWQPTADYLSREIPGHNFVLQPLDFVEVNNSVSTGNVDFILANSAIYVELESRYGASRIATLRNRNGHRGYTRFGGVIFTRADNPAIDSIEDLDGRRFAAVKENSFGGYMMAWREMQEQGVRPDKDTELVFSGTHDAVVYSVLRGLVDAGTVRTDTLERMQVEGKIDLAQLKIINPQQHENFGYLCSTRLYPEWPFAKLKHTSEDLGDDVAIALLRMPHDSAAAMAGLVDGWTVPGNYQLVHELMRELRIGPYADLGRISFADLFRNYWYWLLFIFLILVLSVSVSGYVTRLNLRLREAEGQLINSRDQLAEKVRERTVELEDSHRRLERISRDWNDAFDAIGDPIFIHDVDMRIVQANPAYCEYAGCELEEMLGQPYFHFFPKLDGPLPACVEFPEHSHDEASELQLESGEFFLSRSFGIKQADNSVRHAIHILEDITAQRQAEAEMRRLNRALRTLSLCNTTMVHAQQEQELMDNICNILIEHGGYRFAWVGFALQNKAQTIRPVAYAGEGNEILQEVKISWADSAAGDNPAGYAVRHAQTVVAHADDLADTKFDPWRKMILSRGYASAIALPLISQGDAHGVICIHSTDDGAFVPSEIRLLEEMAGDLSFGIQTLRGRLEHEKAEKALRQTEERYEELYENAPNAYLSVSAEDGRILQFNQALCLLLGYDREEIAGKRILDLYTDGDEGLEKAKQLFSRLQKGKGVRDVDLQMRHVSGHTVWVSVSIDPVLDEQGKVVESRSMMIDISERKRAEEERSKFAEQLQRSLLQAIRAIAITIEKRDPYTAGHQERVAELAVKIGVKLGLAENELEGLRLGALIHDIGKISIPAEILSRPGKLPPEMFNIIKTHPQSGCEIIQGVEFPWPLADIVMQHHERLDGSGYPHGIKDGEIILGARILMVADVVEAMASHRPYRAALGLELALKEIERGRGKQYDAEVVDACLKVFEDKALMADWIKAVQMH